MTNQNLFFTCTVKLSLSPFSEIDKKIQILTTEQENSNTYAKANPVKIEPTFSPGFSTTAGFNGTSAAPATNIIYINGKPAPQQAPHPEI